MADRFGTPAIGGRDGRFPARIRPTNWTPGRGDDEGALTLVGVTDGVGAGHAGLAYAAFARKKMNWVFMQWLQSSLS